MDIKEIRKIAEKELEEETFRKEVEKYKVKLRETKSFWNKVFPFKIIVVRKGVN